MLHLALKILVEFNPDGTYVKTPLANELSDNFAEILIDEFQDTNEAQDTLFSVISNNNTNKFMVGDVKQSIYGFRGSNPNNFLNKKLSYKDYELFKDEDVPKRIILSDNFRSSKGVCEYINFFFSLMLNGELGQLVYDESERLNAAANFPETNETAAKLLLVDMSDSEDEDKLLPYEAKAIAKYILDTVNSKKNYN